MNEPVEVLVERAACLREQVEDSVRLIAGLRERLAVAEAARESALTRERVALAEVASVRADANKEKAKLVCQVQRSRDDQEALKREQRVLARAGMFDFMDDDGKALSPPLPEELRGRTDWVRALLAMVSEVVHVRRERQWGGKLERHLTCEDGKEFVFPEPGCKCPACLMREKFVGIVSVKDVEIGSMRDMLAFKDREVKEIKNKKRVRDEAREHGPRPKE